MTDDKERMYGEWLMKQGYDFDFGDPTWMEEKLDDHSFRDLIGIIDDFCIDVVNGLGDSSQIVPDNVPICK